MFLTGLHKTAALKPLKMVRTRAPIDPVTTRDALGATAKRPFSKPVYQFASGHKPRAALKSISAVRARGY